MGAHCSRGHRLPDECWCPEQDEDEQDERAGDEQDVPGAVPLEVKSADA